MIKHKPKPPLQLNNSLTIICNVFSCYLYGDNAFSFKFGQWCQITFQKCTFLIGDNIILYLQKPNGAFQAYTQY